MKQHKYKVTLEMEVITPLIPFGTENLIRGIFFNGENERKFSWLDNKDNHLVASFKITKLKAENA